MIDYTEIFNSADQNLKIDRQTLDQTEIERLASLEPMAYDRERRDTADKLGVRVETLDEMVKRARKADVPAKQGQALSLPEPEPWQEEVNGQVLLDDIVKAIRNYVILPFKAAEAVALWIVMTYCADIFECLPRLYIHSPTRECGKTTLLSTVSRLAWRSLSGSSITASAIFRVIEIAHPTLCLDEADTYMRNNPEMQSVINSGHTRGTAYIIRNVLIGDNYEPRQFSTYTPIAIAGIGRIHDTTESRSIIIPMRRKKKGETTKLLKEHVREPFAELTQKIRRWTNDSKDSLAKSDPLVPEELGNRAADNWRPLLAIAEVAGGQWPKIARNVAKAFSADSEKHDSSKASQLLTDIKSIFDERKVDKISSKELTERLADFVGSPWAEISHGKEITQNGLARLLNPFGITPSTVRLEAENTPKGYKREQFADAWERYLPSLSAPQTATPPHDGQKGIVSVNLSVADNPRRGAANNSSATFKTAETLGCGAVADRAIEIRGDEQEGGV